jgi:hypothetical protein
VSADQASSAGAFNPALLIVVIGGVLLAAALTWLIRPVRPRWHGSTRNR